MRPIQSKIRTPEELAQIRADLRAQGKRVVQCHGCFDIVHPGHIRYLQFAREQGDVLFVSISADEMVGKGVQRPFINQDLRAENLASFEFVDYVTVDHNTWAGPVLETLRPDVYVKGKEYEQSADGRFLRERALVEGYGGKVIFSSGDVVYSSTLLIKQFQERFGLERERVKFFCKQNKLSKETLKHSLDLAKDKRVLVIGDAILDKYVACDALGVASESPILSVKPYKDTWFLGGGALIAGQLHALGAKATYLTCFGDHAEASFFTAHMKDAGIELRVAHADERPVYVKTRYLVDDRKVFKVDEGRRAPISSAGTKELIALLRETVKSCDAIIATDFGYGLFSADLVTAISEVAREENKPLAVDVSFNGFSSLLHFKHARLATPTERELRSAFGDQESGLSHLVGAYFEATGASRLVLTLGKRGLILFDNKPAPNGTYPADYLPALSSSAIDEVGAGDVLLATLVLMELAGATPAAGAFLGSCVSAVHVNTLGNAPVPVTALLEELDHRTELMDH